MSDVVPVPSVSLELTIEGKKYGMAPKLFKSGSKGWYMGGKAEVNGHRVQLSFSVVIINSKQPEELIVINKPEDLDDPSLFDKNGVLTPPGLEKALKGKKGKKTP